MDIHPGEGDALEHIAGICFKTGPPRHTGVELEWLVCDPADPTAPVPIAQVQRVLEDLGAGDGLPYRSRITLEPGGQIELSSRPATSPAQCTENTAADLAVLRAALDRAGLAVAGYGLEPYRNPTRVLDLPRYRAMEAFFDRGGGWGRMMMRATASVQVNVDAGDDGDGPSGFRSRWVLAHRLGPVLIAAFANSPLWHGRPTGWVSTRQAVWANMDPGRTRPPVPNGDPRADWARYALDADLLCLRRPAPEAWSAPPDLSFRSWLRGVLAERPPTLDDADYHLTTLFPPVRPRGWLELRMIDAQHGDDWVVPTLLVSSLMDDPVAALAAHRATEPLTEGGEVPPWAVWLHAARSGLADPRLREAAEACFTAGRAALARACAPADLQRAVAEFAHRYPERGRCPADDRLDALIGAS
ncbi:ergothioneine biosynthesis glutamate--cysteine ligase EgtA [Streptacidiphilus sp. MAP12-16]|uniref:ergothioneine biosynthesis glutamate--cysteine ligase EgtA n=1 Tax=Streptacidiphilus sp. MAP12-16 TaxID=3156300 RepID=UPI003515D1D3